MDTPSTLKYTRRNLPHWLVADHSYVVTLRLKGTLPKQVIENLRLQRDPSDKAHAAEQARKQFPSIEQILDAVLGDQWLTQPDVASIVWNSLNWLRGRGWLIYAGVLMPNHMHLLMRNKEGRTKDLLDDIARFKNYTAREANKALKRTGSFWARENFDQWIRNREKFAGSRSGGGRPDNAGSGRRVLHAVA